MPEGDADVVRHGEPVEGVDDLIVCSGAYKGNGEIRSVLGLDVDARMGSGLLLRAAFQGGEPSVSQMHLPLTIRR